MSNPQSTSFDQVAEAIGSLYRRRVLLHLYEEDDTDLATLAREVGTVSDARTFELQLHHAELPRLESLGFVDWKHETGSISRGEAFDEIQPLLELLVERADRLPQGLR